MTSDPESNYSKAYRVFKKSSALRFSLNREAKQGNKFDPGCVFLEMAPAIGGNGPKNGYSWQDKKVSVKLNISDICGILHCLRTGERAHMFHSFNESKKSIEIMEKDGGGFFISITHGPEGSRQSVSTPLDVLESLALSTLLSFSIPVI